MAVVAATDSAQVSPVKPQALMLVAGAVWIVAFLPLLVLHFSQLSGQEHLSHFPITILLIGFLFYEGLRSKPRLSFRARPYAITLMIASAFTWAAACYFRSGSLGTVSALLGFWAVVDLGGGRLLRDVFRPAFVLGWALLTLPFGLDRTLIIGLQKIASRIASAWLDLQGIANVTTGVVVRTPEQDFLVEEACSGVNSLFVGLTIALFWALYSRFGVIRTVLFLGTVVFWVLLVNAFRVWAIVYTALRDMVDLTVEPNHTLLGLATFAAVMILAASTDWAFRFLLPPAYGSTSSEAAPGAVEPVMLRSKRPFYVGLGTAGVMCLVSAIALFRPTEARAAAGTIADASLMPQLPPDLLPARLDLWELKSTERKQRDASDAFGMVSQMWMYHNGNFPVGLSVDGPYESWHDLGYCYGATGWQLRDSQNVDLVTEPGQRPIPSVELNLYRGEGQRAVVMFTSIDSQGKIVVPPAAHGSLVRNLTNRLGLSSAVTTADGGAVVPPVFQIQLYAETDSEMTPEERASIDRLYDAARRIIAERLKGSGS